MTTATRVTKPERSGKRAEPARGAPRQRTFNVDEYYRMAEAGVLAADERVELIDGIIVRMAPIGSRHASCVAALTEWFATRLRKNVLVWAQNPVRLSASSEPEPDVVLLRRTSDLYRTAHPGPEDVLLIVEVSDTTLTFDRRVKLPLYATAGIPEVWIVNLAAKQVEVYRAPQAGTYTASQTHDATSTVTPLAFPRTRLPLREIFG